MPQNPEKRSLAVTHNLLKVFIVKETHSSLLIRQTDSSTVKPRPDQPLLLFEAGLRFLGLLILALFLGSSRFTWSRNCSLDGIFYRFP